jgi:acyl-CoA hydrolase
MGILQGGKLVQGMDLAAAIVAQLHSGKLSVTVSINEVNFLSPARTGDIVSIKAIITRAFHSSMEILVTAEARNILNRQSCNICEALFTFVAMDENGKTSPAPGVKPVSAFEKKNFELAGLRREKIL